MGGFAATASGLLGVERLEERARALARSGGARARPGRFARAPAPPGRERARLREAYRAVADDVHEGDPISPAAEWLLDNFHLIEAEARNVQRRPAARLLPPAAPRSPTTGAGRRASTRWPRSCCAHSDAPARRRAADALRRPRTRRSRRSRSASCGPGRACSKLALLENLRRLRGRHRSRRAGPRAGHGDARRPRAADAAALPPLPRPLPAPFVVAAASSACASTARARRRCARSSTSACGAAARRSRTSSAARAPAAGAPSRSRSANAITSLRLLRDARTGPRSSSASSLVEQVLQRDPAGVYGRMDFPSRDRYRQAVEELAEPTGEARSGSRCARRARAAAAVAAADDDRGAPRRLLPDRRGPRRARARARHPARASARRVAALRLPRTRPRSTSAAARR